MKKGIYIFLTVLLLLSCSVKPEPLNYGKDACSFCQMTIVEKKFGAEIVTKKGKVYKYDAIECLLNDLKERDESAIKYFMVIDYDNPTVLIDATTAYYLKSEKIPSPMGAFLSAYIDEGAAKKSQEVNGGEVYSWGELKKNFNN